MAAGVGSRMALAVLPDFGARGSRRSELGAAERQAREVMERAQEDARRLMEGAHQKATDLLAEARREGELQGKAEALAQAQTTIAAALETLAGAGQQLQRIAADSEGRQEQVIIELAIALATRILDEAIGHDPARFLPVVRRALAALPPTESVVVRCHPAVAEVATTATSVTTDAVLKIVADPELSIGDCRIEAGATSVEAGLKAQLEEAGRRLRDEPW